jgi:hypothetical protein
MATLQTAAFNMLRLGGFQSDPGRHAGGDARHRDAACNGDASAKAQDGLKI